MLGRPRGEEASSRRLLMAEAGDVGGGSRQAPLLLEHLRMHFLKEENNSPLSSGQNLSSSVGSAGPSPTSLLASGTIP